MSETYPAGGAKNLIHGFICQLKWLMLFLKRAMDKEYSFRLATELRLAASFDDLVFQYEQNGKIIHRFMQIKHTRKRYKKISIDDLLTHKKNDDFGLVKYLIAYFIIKGSGKFDNGILEDFIIATNADFDLKSLVDKKISVTKIKTKDDFLSIGNSARYKLKDLKGNIAQYLKQSMASMKDKLSKKISNGKKISDEEIDKGIKDFLNKLVFAVNLPNEVELSEIIKNELGKEFNNIDRKNVYSRFQEEALDWMKAEEGKFLSHEEINEFFEKIREEILGAIWFGIIEPVASFTGRSSELKALHDALQRSTVRPAIISQVATISGLGGIGKSEFARQYAYTYGKDYYANVIWINAESVETMKNSFLGLVKDDRLGISTKDRYERDKTIENIVREIYAFFARRKGKSLFIFDNAEGYENIKRFLPSSLHPRHKKPYILITSRDCKWNVRGESDIKVIQLDKFGEVEALEFVRKALNIENNLQDREIEELTRELQYFPLALGQAVVYIQDRNEESRLRGDKRFKISDYLKEYQQNAGELLKKGIYENEDRYTKTVLTTWNVTMTYICKEYGFEALSILEIMAYLAPDNICIKEIFSKLITDDKAKLWNAVELLNRYSMIKLREGVVNIHSLVQKVTRLKLQENRQEEEVLRKALELINSGGLAQGSMSHIAFVWGYASTYGKLIDNFYFNSFYVYGGTLFIRKSTPLHLLAESGDCKAISAIITHIEKYYPGELVKIVNVKDNHGQTLLHIAAKSGNLNVMKCLVNKGASTNTKDKYDNTPLHSAAYYAGELDIVKYLIIKNNNINAKGEYGRTPLHIAAINGDLDMVEYLIKRYANIDAKDNCGMTPLHLAADVGELGIVEHLINEDAYVDARDEHYRTPLFFAAENGKLNVVKCLIEKGANVNAKNEYGETALHRVVYKATFSGDLRIVEFLINKGANVNARDRNSRTLLHYSALSGSCNIAECLIREGANINAKDKDGNTALHLAVIRQKVDITRTLLKHNANVNARNNLGNTVLDCAVDNCQELVELLLTHDESVEVA